MRKTRRKPPPIQTSRWHKVRRSRGRPEHLLKPPRAKSKRRKAARVRGAAVQRVGRPRPQEARGLQIPESTCSAPGRHCGQDFGAAVCRLLALSGHFGRTSQCPLLGAKLTSRLRCEMSASDPERTLPPFYHPCRLVRCLCSGRRVKR
jgi:hypothetical protein